MYTNANKSDNFFSTTNPKQYLLNGFVYGEDVTRNNVDSIRFRIMCEWKYYNYLMEEIVYFQNCYRNQSNYLESVILDYHYGECSIARILEVTANLIEIAENIASFSSKLIGNRPLGK